MDSDLEQRWQRAVVAKNITQDELSRLVAKMEAGVMVPSNWNQRIRDSIEKEKAEVEKRYRVKIGRTSITCSRCGGPWGFGGHSCQDVRFEQLKEKAKIDRDNVMEQMKPILDRVREIGASKLSTISFDRGTGSFISQNAVNKWIHKGKIPIKHLERVSSLLKTV